MMVEEIKAHLINDIIPFWKGLRDDEFGGFVQYFVAHVGKDVA